MAKKSGKPKVPKCVVEFKLELSHEQQKTLLTWMDKLRHIWNKGMPFYEEDQQRRWRKKTTEELAKKYSDIDFDLESDRSFWKWHCNMREAEGSDKQEKICIGSGYCSQIAMVTTEKSEEGELIIKEYIPAIAIRRYFDVEDPIKQASKLTSEAAHADRPDIQAICSRLRMGVVKDLIQAWKNYRNPNSLCRKPRYKDGKRRKIETLSNYNGGTTVSFTRIGDSDNAWVKFPILEGRARVKGLFKRLSPETPYTVVKITHRASGFYLQVTCERPKRKYPQTTRACGIDVGLQFIIADDRGNVVLPSKHLRKAEKRLRRLQRKLARQQKDSNNSLKTKQRIAKLHELTALRRKGDNNQISAKVIRSCNEIAVEDIQVKNLMRTPKPKKSEDGKGYAHNGAKAKSGLNKSFADAGLGQLLRMIADKAEVAGKVFVKVNPAYTSQTCPQCKNVVKKSLSTRTHHCKECGYIAPRDVAAAQIIKERAFGNLRDVPGFSRGADGQPSMAADCSIERDDAVTVRTDLRNGLRDDGNLEAKPDLDQTLAENIQLRSVDGSPENVMKAIPPLELDSFPARRRRRSPSSQRNPDGATDSFSRFAQLSLDLLAVTGFESAAPETDLAS